MAGWYERGVQTSFTPTPDGYVFRCANPWLFGRWRSYLVNEVQKESLAGYLRQRQRLALWLLGFYLLVAFVLSLLFGSSGSAPDPAAVGFYAFLVPALVGLLVLGLVPHVYLMRKIAPVLAQLQRAEAPVPLREQIFGVAAVISNLHIALGGGGGVLVAAANIKTIAEELSAGRVGTELLWPGFGLVAGLLLAGYFWCLFILKRRLKRKTN
jgi:hypothetical protein